MNRQEQLESLVGEVAEMRRLQKKYFSTKSTAAILEDCKRQEHAVDVLVTRLKSRQVEMFA